MSVVRPKYLLALMRDHWSFLQRLTLAAQESPLFDLPELDRWAALEMADRSPTERMAVLEEMRRKGVLQEFPRSSDLQLHPAVQSFIEAMTHEFQLGPVGVIKAYVEGLEEATTRINTAVAAGQFNQVVLEATMRLQMLCRNIRANVDNDYLAILNLVEQAKGSDANIPSSVRYERVLDAYDRYILPMTDLIRPGPSGQFDRYILAAEQSLDLAERALERAGVSPRLQRDVRNVALMLKDLPGHTRDRVNHAVSILMPLREQIRRHSAMSTAVVRILSVVRKRGAAAALPVSMMPDFSRSKVRLVNLGLPLLKTLGQIRDYNPAKAEFPSMGALQTAVHLDAVTQNQVHAAFQAANPSKIPDVLLWVHDTFPELDDTRCLGLYHWLLTHADWEATPSGPWVELALSGVDVGYHPHQLTERS